MIGIVNYRIGNLHNLKNALDVQNIANCIVEQPSDLQRVDKILIPGVGAFATAMRNFQELGFEKSLLQCIQQGVPVLGVCVGMQLLFTKSYENGEHAGLNCIPGEVKRIVNKQKIPHTGWNQLNYTQQHPLFDSLPANPWVYYVHSYCVAQNPYSLAVSEYGGACFSAIVAYKNCYGFQFHPEKSQAFGLSLLKNFASL